MKAILLLFAVVLPVCGAQSSLHAPPSLLEADDSSSLPDALSKLSTQTTPEPFIQELYRELQQPPAPPPFVGSHGASHIYANPLLTAMHHEFAASNRGFAGQLVFNPFCSCQDSTGLTLSTIALAPTDKKHTDATFTVHLPPVNGSEIPDRVITLHLVRNDKGWRVDDISSTQVHSLKLLLRTPNP